MSGSRRNAVGEWKPPSYGAGCLIHGDNLAVMDRLSSAWGPCLDFVYADPPFFSGRTRRGTSGNPGEFPDRWPGGLEEYLAWLRPRFALMRELLRDTGSFMVHLDHRAAHHVKVELDRLFGRDRFLNEIIWHYTGGGRSRRYFSRKHDNLLWYRKGKRWTFRIDAVRVPYRETSGYARAGIVSATGKRYLPHPEGTPVDDVWDIPMVNPMSAERNGYPTQKPEALLRRIVNGCTAPRDLVADFFGGSGTTGAVALKLRRRWILCDESRAAIEVTRKRIEAIGRGRFHPVRPVPGLAGFRFLPGAAEDERPRQRSRRPVPEPAPS